MDIAMPNLNGLEVTARVAAEFPSVRVIILSMHANEEYALQALRAGAYGYVLKRSAFDELVSAIQAVAQGGTYFCAPIARQLADITVEDLQAWEAPLGRLTLRQREVLQLIAEGKNTKEMAHLLNVSTKTVEFHRAQLMKRLSIYDVAGVVRFAIRSGVIPPE
jgi:DNA-binding NarL/FixJ family response regulator